MDWRFLPNPPYLAPCHRGAATQESWLNHALSCYADRLAAPGALNQWGQTNPPQLARGSKHSCRPDFLPILSPLRWYLSQQLDVPRTNRPPRQSDSDRSYTWPHSREGIERPLCNHRLAPARWRPGKSDTERSRLRILCSPNTTPADWPDFQPSRLRRESKSSAAKAGPKIFPAKTNREPGYDARQSHRRC